MGNFALHSRSCWLEQNPRHMKQSYSNKAINQSCASVFWITLAGRSLTSTLLTWLILRASLTASGWQQRMRDYHLNSDNPEALNQWLALQPSPPSPRFLFLPSAVVIVIGILSMVTTLTYSGSRPVNIWLMFAVFCFLPFLLTLLSCISLFHLGRSGQAFVPALLARWLHKFSHGVLSLGAFNSLAVRAWLLLQSQLLGLFLQLSLMATFLLVLLFNDVAFGWASTIIHSADTLKTVLQYLTLPWQWLLPAPSAELIQQSQYFYGAANLAVNAEAMRAWWPHIFLAMALYGLAPKIFLVILIRWRCGQLLRNEINSSAELEQFYSVLNFSSSVHAKNIPDTTSAAYNATSRLNLKNTDAIVCWQRPCLVADIPVLGVKTWRDDEAWLKLQSPLWLNHLWVVVQEHQTPTAELTDTLECIKALNTHLNIHLTVITVAAASINQPLSLALKTWQFFAVEQQLSLHSALCVYREDQLIIEANVNG